MSIDGLLHAFLLDGKGHGRELTHSEIPGTTQDGEFFWLHFDYTQQQAQDWLSNSSELHPADVEALLKDETRPRTVVSQDGLLVNLRGVNLNPGANPEDMVALRIWLNGNRIITTRYRRHMWEADMLAAITAGKAPVSCGDFLAVVADLMVGRIHDVVEYLEEQVAGLEETMLEKKSQTVRNLLVEMRRQAINLRRYLAPQREAMARLQSDKISWFTEADRMYLRESHDRMVRVVEDLDATRERAAIAMEELANRVAEQLNQRMYMLSMVAAMFMPLTFLTGLLGINVGGIPGAENKQAFLWVCYILGAVGLLLYLIFRKRKWM
ncbi:MAG: zinc transporter ZntB [Gammaproteobacteria bacterium]|nr:zinc transporter ZntB [Gammaproteobacteria bacterium]MDH5778770.1 zinc transporter ZntB [Gammaproteobacteria bacterium]